MANITSHGAWSSIVFTDDVVEPTSDDVLCSIRREGREKRENDKRVSGNATANAGRVDFQYDSV